MVRAVRGHGEQNRLAACGWHSASIMLASDHRTKQNPPRTDKAVATGRIRETSMLMELLSKGTTVASVTFVASSMLAMGAGLTVAEIIDQLRNTQRLALALVANFVFVPIAALILTKVLHLDEPLGVGLLLLGCAAGAPFLPKLAELAKGNLAFAVGVMVLLTVITVGYLPVVLPLLLPGVTVNPVKIGSSLVVLMLFPLAGGL